jgi:uncharacterized protein (DUF983 family)
MSEEADLSGPAPRAPLPRPMGAALARGLRRRCPRCALGPLFGAYLKVRDNCPRCGEALHHHRADDAPAYVVILVVGHLVVPLALVVETLYAPPYWVHLSLWGPLTIALALGLLEPVKGAIVAWQWALGMHGFEQRAPSRAEPGANAAESRR